MLFFFFFSSRRRHTRCGRDWSSDVCSSDLGGCADLVTASQSLQWMRPERALPEIGRILRPGGVFCAYEYFVGQTPLWEPVVAFDAVQVRKRELRARLGLDAAKLRWPVSRERLEQSGI